MFINDKKNFDMWFSTFGTSILKSVIGHIESVDEVVDECEYINRESNKEYILCKYPFTKEIFFSEKYSDYIKIFIIRNPLFIFSSLNKRFQYNIPYNHDISVYVDTVKMYKKHQGEPNVYTIKYEEIFPNDYKNLKKILDSIGFVYDNDIFNNENYVNTIISGVPIKKRATC